MSEVLLSQLAYVELVSPRPEETVRWMIDVLGLEESAREGQSVYLRGFAEWLHSSMIVTEGPEPGLGRIGWRTYGPGDPETIAQRIDGEWVAERPGRGAAYAFRAPAGKHLHEVFWETELFEASAEQAEPDQLFRPQRYTGRGAVARYLDHVTIASPAIGDDIAFYKTLGARNTAQIHAEPGFNVFSTMTCNGVRHTHDIGLVPDFSGMTGRVNHIAYRGDQRLDVERAAEVFLANDTAIEFGPGIHGIDEITYLYVREPGGMRIEINAGGWVNQMPDWQAPVFGPRQSGTTLWKNIPMPESMMECWPAVSGQQADEATSGFQSTDLFADKA
jgi:catechol 2,3-dioxygenase